MPIEFRCTGCGKMLRTPDESVGQKARCPGCGTILTVPSASATSPATPASSATAASPAGLPAENPGGFGVAPGSAGMPAGSIPAGGAAAGGAFFPGREPPVNDYRAAANPFVDGSAGTGPSLGGTGGYAAGTPGGPGGDPRGSMGANPYAAPLMTPPTPLFVPGAALAHRQLNMEQLLRTTWEFVRDQFWMVVLLGLILMASGFVSGIITTPLNIAAQATNDISIVISAQVLGQGLGVFVQVFVQLASIYTALQWARSGSIDVANLFKVGPFYLRGLGLTLLMQLIIAGVVLVSCIPLLASIPYRNEVATITCGVVAFLIAAPIVVWLSLSWYIALPFMVDRNTSIRQSLALSRSYMAGNKMTLFVASLLFGLIALPLVLCTCFLGAIPLGPAASMLTVLTYLICTGQAFYQPGARPAAMFPQPGFAGTPGAASPFPPSTNPYAAGSPVTPLTPPGTPPGTSPTPPAFGQDYPGTRPPGSLS